MEDEKYQYEVSGERKVSYDDAAHLAQEQGVTAGEAAEAFGNVETLEQYGYVHRGYVQTLSY